MMHEVTIVAPHLRSQAPKPRQNPGCLCGIFRGMPSYPVMLGLFVNQYKDPYLRGFHPFSWICFLVIFLRIIQFSITIIHHHLRIICVHFFPSASWPSKSKFIYLQKRGKYHHTQERWDSEPSFPIYLAKQIQKYWECNQLLKISVHRICWT